jgi:hypothetical protein
MNRSPEHGAFEDFTVNGTNVRLAVRKSPGGMAGAWATWGERIPQEVLKGRVLAAVPDLSPTKLTDSGFSEIWHQEVGMTRADSVAAQINALDVTIPAALDANNLRADELRGLGIGSGVPIIDELNGVSLTDFVAERYGMSNLIYQSETYAACNSGEIEEINLLKQSALEGQPTLHLGWEGVTYLTPFEKEKTDPLSMWTFGDGMAAKVIYPGADLKLLHSHFNVVPEAGRVLRAKMTYDHLIDHEALNIDPSQIWQQSDDGRIQWLVGQNPPEGMLLNMDPENTALTFALMAENVVATVYGDYRESLGLEREAQSLDSIDQISEELNPQEWWTHHPQITISGRVAKKLRQRHKIDLHARWVVFTGNSSGATSSMAGVELLPVIEPGKIYGSVAYGAGASEAGAIMRAGTRWTHRMEDPNRTVFQGVDMPEAA